MTMVVPSAFKPEISPETRSNSISRSITLAYDFKITNAGTQNDNFNIHVMGNKWPTSLSNEFIGPLIPGEMANLNVKVFVPGSAQIGDQDLAELTVTSQSDPGISIQAQIITTVREPLLFIPFNAK